MRGKYSPTVVKAYCVNRDWFTQYAGDQHYDPDGFDSYGYDINDVDRAGNNEFDYMGNDANLDGYDGYDWNDKYDLALADWTFDGVKPIERK